MLNIGECIMQLRKKKGLSQSELAKQVGASRTIIGNYERNTNAPSIEMLAKLARVFGVSVDYLIGEASQATFDREVLKRIEEIERLDKATKGHLFFLIDSVIQNFKTKEALN